MTIKKCFKCKKEFNADSLINYNGKNYCPSCHKLKLDYDFFSQRICEIFKLKAPGPIINKQRDTLIKNGFTDATIIKTIEYCYFVKKITRPSIDYINLETVEEAKRYYKDIDYKENLTIESIGAINYITHYVPRRVEEEKKEEDFNILNYMEDDVF